MSGRYGTCAIAVAAALSLVAAAGAKGPVSGTVCGASGCAALAEPGAAFQALRWEGTFQIVRAPRPARFYRLTFTSPDPGGFRWTVLYVPARRVLRVDDRAATPPEYGTPVRPYWRTLGMRQLRLLGAVTSDLAPFRAPRRWPAG